ncbi:MAG: hypothetical protein ACI8S6_003071 [Myxococcota bacterium]|jgi:hypothetical protein
MGLLDRIRRRLRPQPTPKPKPEPGRRLPDGTILERCRLVTTAELTTLLTPQGTPQLHIHWRVDDDCAHDLPDLRELHLFWAHHATFIGICWEHTLTTPRPPLSESARAVDAWHRDYGLTWESLLLDGAGPPPQEAAGRIEPTLPQVILRGADGVVLFHRVGRLEEADRARLALVLRERCSG